VAANEELYDSLLQHTVNLQRMTQGEVQNILGELRKADAELNVRIAQRMEKTGGVVDFTTERWQNMVGEIKRMRSSLIQGVGSQLGGLSDDIVENTINATVKALSNAVPVEINFAAPSVATVQELARETPFGGVDMATDLLQWFVDLEEADLRRISGAVKAGMVQGEGTPEIINRVMKAQELTRQNADAIARTMVNHASNTARTEVFVENADVIQALMAVATLDGRTSPICRARDGHYDALIVGGDMENVPHPRIEGSPRRPPFHPRCRTVMIAKLDGDGIEAMMPDRPFVRDKRTRRMREKDFRAEAKAELGKGAWSQLSVDERNALIKSRRQQWVAENVGTLPGDTTYDAWLRKQPKSFQDDVLGPTRGDLFRNGLAMDQYVDLHGRQLTIAELKAKYGTTDDIRAMHQKNLEIARLREANTAKIARLNEKVKAAQAEEAVRLRAEADTKIAKLNDEVAAAKTDVQRAEAEAKIKRLNAEVQQAQITEKARLRTEADAKIAKLNAEVQGSQAEIARQAELSRLKALKETRAPQDLLDEKELWDRDLMHRRYVADQAVREDLMTVDTPTESDWEFQRNRRVEMDQRRQAYIERHRPELEADLAERVQRAGLIDPLEDEAFVRSLSPAQQDMLLTGETADLFRAGFQLDRLIEHDPVRGLVSKSNFELRQRYARVVRQPGTGWTPEMQDVWQLRATADDIDAIRTWAGQDAAISTLQNPKTKRPQHGYKNLSKPKKYQPKYAPEVALEHLNQALSTMPVYDGEVYRGVGMWADDLDALLEAGSFELPHHSSASVELQTAHMFAGSSQSKMQIYNKRDDGRRVVYVIKKQHNSRLIMDYALQDESEALLMKGTKYRMTKPADITPDGTYVLELEEVDHLPAPAPKKPKDPAPKKPKVDVEKKAAATLEAARVKAAKIEAAAQKKAEATLEAARVQAEKLEAARIEAAKAAKVEAARVKEAARVQAAKVEAARVQAAKVEAAKVRAAKVEAKAKAKAELEKQKAIAAAKRKEFDDYTKKVAAEKAEKARIKAEKAEAARLKKEPAKPVEVRPTVAANPAQDVLDEKELWSDDLEGKRAKADQQLRNGLKTTETPKTSDWQAQLDRQSNIDARRAAYMERNRTSLEKSLDERIRAKGKKFNPLFDEDFMRELPGAEQDLLLGPIAGDVFRLGVPLDDLVEDVPGGGLRVISQEDLLLRHPQSARTPGRGWNPAQQDTWTGLAPKKYKEAIMTWTDHDAVLSTLQNPNTTRPQTAYKTTDFNLYKPKVPPKQALEHLNEALSTMPVYDGVVYRGVGLRADQIKLLTKQGAHFSLPAHSSSSTSLMVARDFANDAAQKIGKKGEQVVFHVAKQHNGRMIMAQSTIEEEYEVLLMQGTKYKVTGYQKVKGIHTFTVEEVDGD
jgi:hypothetical protein